VNETIEQLQTLYLESRSETDFNNLYRSVSLLARRMVITKLKKFGSYDESRAGQYSTEAAHMFMMMYINHPGWSCKYFKTRLARDVTNRLYTKRHKEDRYYYEHNTSLEHIDIPYTEKQETKPDILEILKTDKDSTFIYMTLIKVSTKEDYLKLLATKKTIQWIKEYIVQLLCLYDSIKGGSNGTKKTRNKERYFIGKDTTRTKGMVR